MTVIFRSKFGSNLYGTNTPSSDTDYKSVYVPSARDIILQHADKVIQTNTKEDTTLKNSSIDVDDEQFSFKKFMTMLKSGDMIAIELLFIPLDFAEIKSDIWLNVLANRDKLLSRGIKGFIGYCRKQASKYGIKGSRVAAMRDARDTFARLDGHSRVGEYGWDILKRLKLTHPEHIFIKDIPQVNGTSLTHIEICNRLIPYNIKVKDAYNIVNRIFEQYGQRPSSLMQINMIWLNILKVLQDFLTK